jgi:predicted dehydrogenase
MGNWHFENISKRIPELKVVGAYDIRPEQNALAKKNGLVAYESAEELLADKTIDIVTIATPNNFHRDLSIAALKAGKTVICEKPVTMNALELEEIIAVSKETGNVFSIHHNRRWDSDYLIIKDIIETGVIGFPLFIESRVEGSRGAMHGWRDFKVNGGGMLLDWGIHLIDQIMNMIDEKVVSVGASLVKAISSEVDDNIKVFLRFKNGIVAQIEVMTNCFVNLPRWRVIGKDGTAVVENWDCDGKIVKLDSKNRLEWSDVIVYTAAGPTRTMAPRPTETTLTLPLTKIPTDWAEYYRNILDVLDNGADLIVKPDQALRVMKVIDLIFKSEEDGRGYSCEI